RRCRARRRCRHGSRGSLPEGWGCCCGRARSSTGAGSTCSWSPPLGAVGETANVQESPNISQVQVFLKPHAVSWCGMGLLLGTPVRRVDGGRGLRSVQPHAVFWSSVAEWDRATGGRVGHDGGASGVVLGAPPCSARRSPHAYPRLRRRAASLGSWLRR